MAFTNHFFPVPNISCQNILIFTPSKLSLCFFVFFGLCAQTRYNLLSIIFPTVVFQLDAFPEECYSRITLCQQYFTGSDACSGQLEDYFRFGSPSDPLYRIQPNDLAFSLIAFNNALSTPLKVEAKVVNYSSNCRQNETQPCVLGSLNEDDVVNCTYTTTDVNFNEITVGDCINGTTELNLDLNGTGVVLFKRERPDCGPSDLVFVISLPGSPTGECVK